VIHGLGPRRGIAFRLLVCTVVLVLPLCLEGSAWSQGEELPGPGTAEPILGEQSEITRRSATPRPVLAGPVDAEKYRLGPGDLLSLEYGGKAFDSRFFVVDGEGRVGLPNLGVVLVAGNTLSEARADILKHLRAYLPGATLDLRLIEPRTFRVYVLGEVKQPGSAEVMGSARALEAIERAGGLTENASRRNIRIIRRDGAVVPVDFDRFDRTGDWDANPFLEDGDRMIVPLVIERMGIFGSVPRPGGYEFRSGDSLSTAIRLAGGLLPEARPDSVLVLRFHGSQGLDSLYVNLEENAGSGAAILLQADDRVFIHPQPQWHPSRQVSITGEVNSPGVYAIHEGTDHVSDLVRWAGGVTPQAARRNVRLERRLPATDQDVEFDRLNKLSRGEMTNSEYQTFRSKLAVRQSAYLIDFSGGSPKPPTSDVLLRDGDRIDVGRLELAVRVDGSVKNPGLLAFDERRSVSDYIKMAGGPTRRANTGDARLTRAGTGNTLFARDAETIEPGDFIWVPEKKETSFWSVLRDIVLVSGQVATIILVVDQLNR
jgi:protein involved in polysaccharide export with SLBB domain